MLYLVRVALEGNLDEGTKKRCIRFRYVLSSCFSENNNRILDLQFSTAFLLEKKSNNRNDREHCNHALRLLRHRNDIQFRVLLSEDSLGCPNC